MKLKEGRRKNDRIHDFKNNDNSSNGVFRNIKCIFCSEAENGIRRSYFICVRNVTCAWNNFYVGIGDVVTGDYANYPISQC